MLLDRQTTVVLKLEHYAKQAKVLDRGRTAQRRAHALAFRNTKTRTMPEGTMPFTFSVAIYRDSEETWRIRTEHAGSNGSRPLRNPPSWLGNTRDTRWTTRAYGKDETIACESSEPHYLVRQRMSKILPDGSSTVDTEPTDGILIWIEQYAATP